jgi:hypothetical protein
MVVKIVNTSFEALLVPAGISLWAKKYRTLVIVYTMNSITLLGKK